MTSRPYPDPDAPSRHVPSECDTCGQYDDHPKLHYGEETFHHDTACLPVRVRRDIGDHPMVSAITAAADSGLHGEDLRQHVVAIHAPAESTEV